MLVNGEKLNINENVIENSFKRNFIINDHSNDYRSRVKLCSDREAEDGAERYIRKLNAPGCRDFFIKVMYYLPYDDREKILESATKKWVKKPAHYFTFCAKKELLKRGIE